MQTLTEKQRAQWAIDGYIHLEKVFSPDEVDFYSDQIDQIGNRPVA